MRVEPRFRADKRQDFENSKRITDFCDDRLEKKTYDVRLEKKTQKSSMTTRAEEPMQVTDAVDAKRKKMTPATDNEEYLKQEVDNAGVGAIDWDMANCLFSSGRFKSLRAIKHVATRCGIKYNGF